MPLTGKEGKKFGLGLLVEVAAEVLQLGSGQILDLVLRKGYFWWVWQLPFWMPTGLHRDYIRAVWYTARISGKTHWSLG